MEITKDYIAPFNAFEQQLNGLKDTSIHEQRKAALLNLEKLGLPTSKLEAWKYTNLTNVWKEIYTPYSISSDTEAPAFERYDFLNAHRIVFVNGKLNKELSEILDEGAGITISPLTEALKANNETLNAHLGKLSKSETDAVQALNTAYTQDGIFVHAAKGKSLEHPVLVTHVFTEEIGKQMVNFRNVIVAEANANIKVIESYQDLSSNNTAFVNGLSEIFVSADANVDRYVLQLDKHPAVFIGNVEVLQDKNSHYYSNTVNFGGNLVRHNQQVVLGGEYADCSLFGLYDVAGKDHVDNKIYIDHAVPNCESNQFYKGLMDDKSVAIFNGKVMVRQDAQKTNAYQTNRNILLSDNATINSKPELEIYADDVKCSHGATTGQLDDEALFYMVSRGIPREKAGRLLTQAFIAEVIDAVKIEALKDYLHGLLEKQHHA